MEAGQANQGTEALGMWRYSSYSLPENRRPLRLYSKARVRAEKERAGKRGEPSVLISYHCSVTPTVTFML